MKTNIFYIVLIACFIYVSGCNDSSVTIKEEAVKMTILELKTNPNYSSFSTQLLDYQPDPNIINQIKTLYNSSNDKFYFFADLSCGCGTQQLDIAKFSKVLQAANISEDNYEIYTMRKTTYKHPYQSVVNIGSLPAGFFIKSDSCRYSLIDTLNLIKMKGNSAAPDSILLEALKK